MNRWQQCTFVIVHQEPFHLDALRPPIPNTVAVLNEIIAAKAFLNVTPQKMHLKTLWKKNLNNIQSGSETLFEEYSLKTICRRKPFINLLVKFIREESKNNVILRKGHKKFWLHSFFFFEMLKILNVSEKVGANRWTKKKFTYSRIKRENVGAIELCGGVYRSWREWRAQLRLRKHV